MKKRKWEVVSTSFIVQHGDRVLSVISICKEDEIYKEEIFKQAHWEDVA